MVFAEELFIGETVKDLSTIMYSLNKGIPVFNIYCVCWRSGGNGLIEIFNSRELLKPRQKQKDYTVIGIAGGKYEAYDLVRYIFQYARDKNIDISETGRALSRREGIL